METKEELIDKASDLYLESLKIKGAKQKFKTYLFKKDRDIYLKLLKFFKEFNDAYKEITKAAILKLYKRGFDLSPGNVRKEHNALYRIACYLLRSWENAIKAAGLDYAKILRRAAWIREETKVPEWSKNRVIYEILARHKKGFDLSLGNVKKECRSLNSGACRLFESWENAIKAAGLYYGLIRKDINKRISRIWENNRLHKKLIKVVEKKCGVSEIIKEPEINEDIAVNLFCLAVASILLDEKKIHSKEILDAESKDNIHLALERFWLPKNKIGALQLEREIGRNLKDWEK